jgi:hypothetical protein
MPAQTQTTEINNYFMSTEEYCLIDNLEANEQQFTGSSRLSLKDCSNILNWNSSSNTNQDISGPNKRKNPKKEQYQIPKKSGRKPGSKDKTLKREAREAEMRSKENNESNR